MTTISYNHKDKEIAVDSRLTCGGTITSDKQNKTQIENGVLFIFCGKCCDQDLLVDYYFDRNKSNLLPEASAFVVDRGIAYALTVSDDGVVNKYKMQHNDARGSGEQFALAAMDFGCSAKDAVKYTMTRDIYTGGKIRVIKVK